MTFLDYEAISIDIGKRIRKLRQARKMSLRALARASGLSPNALSMIERGRTSPSVSTLYRLADALNVPITAFFQTESQRQDVVFLKAGQRSRVPFARGVWEGLGGERFTGRMEPFLLTLETGASSGPFLMAHTGHEFVLCLRGRLEYEVEGETYLLEPGDSLLFAAHLKHRWRNAGQTVTNALFVLSGFSEDEHPGHFHWNTAEYSASKDTESISSKRPIKEA